jgi:Asp-tRNA(Asn)/Glu-tRNA(Gln) amidotransferase A subunit family amidase
LVCDCLLIVPFSDDPDVFDGAPANVMIVGRSLEEEKVLALAQVLVDALAAA